MVKTHTPSPGLEGPPRRPERPVVVSRIKRRLVGAPLPTDRLAHERLGKPTALAVFASDNLSSSAYATEEILRVLLYAGFGVAAFSRVVPITLAMLVVLAVLFFSYRQTIRAYPQAGGAYLVTRDNFGVLPAQVAGTALLTDYVLTVSVSVSAGTAALTSVFEDLHPYRVAIAVGFITILTIGNLRGVKESGRLFAAPTYFFLVMMFTLLGVGSFQLLTGSLPDNASQFPVPDAQNYAGLALVFLVLRAFASGGAAVTGVEAISNGVPAFRPPEWKSAITTLMWMGALLGAMFLGLSIMASRLEIVPDPHEKVTVIAQIARAVFGEGGLGQVLFVALQAGTVLILVLAANTSFADFPRLASFHAGDHFLPRQLTRYGDRLVFSNGIVALAGFAALLVWLFDASVTRLIPLYAIGVFTSFTFSQAGMAKHHVTRKEQGWRKGLAINGFGAVVTAVMTLIIAATKFADGAYIILIAIPVMLVGLLRVNHHYKEASTALRDPSRRVPIHDLPTQSVVIPVGRPGPEDNYAVAYSRRLFPREIRLFHAAPAGTSVDYLSDSWGHLDEVIDGRLRQRDLRTEVRNYVREIQAGSEGDHNLVNVIIPETVTRPGWAHVLHNLRVQRIKAALVREKDVVVTNVTAHAGYEDLEPVGPPVPRQLVAEWRHVSIVLVAGVNNATARALRYGLSLQADELRCLHVEVERTEADRVLREWQEWDMRVPLQVLESPYRQIARPLHAYVRAILEERPRTFVTLVIPEFVERSWWHRFLHSQTALTLKGVFLFEPSVVVSAVPYQL
jgi:amino acid transporter